MKIGLAMYLRPLLIWSIGAVMLISVGRVHAAPDEALEFPGNQTLLPVLQKALLTACKTDANSCNEGGKERIWVRSLHQVKISRTEDAWLVSAWMPDRVRNQSSTVFLYRPTLRSAREMRYGSVQEVLGPGHFPEYAVLGNYGSGQGSEDFVHDLGHFKGWNFEILHSLQFENNLGISTGKSDGWIQQKWSKMQLLRGRKQVELVVWSVLAKERENGADRTVTNETHRYLLNNGKFVLSEITEK